MRPPGPGLGGLVKGELSHLSPPPPRPPSPPFYIQRQQQPALHQSRQPAGESSDQFPFCLHLPPTPPPPSPLPLAPALTESSGHLCTHVREKSMSLHTSRVAAYTPLAAVGGWVGGGWGSSVAQQNTKRNINQRARLDRRSEWAVLSGVTYPEQGIHFTEPAPPVPIPESSA